jgi:hypothetical protein
LPEVLLDSLKKSWIEVVAGVFLGLLVLVVGIRLYTLGEVNSDPLNPTAQIGLTYLLGSTWGYNFGLSIRRDESAKGEFVLLASFFGTLILSFAGYALYSIFYTKVFDPVFSVAILAFAMISFAALTHSKAVDRAHVKQLLDLFSNKASPVVLSGYATATVSNPVAGVGVSIGVAVSIVALPRLYRKAESWWKQRRVVESYSKGSAL